MDITNDKEPRSKFVFDHSRLDVHRVLLEALVAGEKLARASPRGYAVLADQLRRALQGAYLQFVEGVARSGADRVSRLRCSRAEACEAAGCIEAIAALGLAKSEQTERLLELQRGARASHHAAPARRHLAPAHRCVTMCDHT